MNKFLVLALVVLAAAVDRVISEPNQDDGLEQGGSVEDEIFVGGMSAEDAVGYDPYELQDYDAGDEMSAIQIIPPNDQEVASLSKDHEMFEDYCIKSRDAIFKYVKDSTDYSASLVFKIMFSSITDVATLMVEAEKSAVEESAKIIREEVPKPKELVESKEEAQEELDTSIEKVSTLMDKVSSAVKLVLQMVIGTASDEIFQRLNALRQRFTGETLKEVVEEVCRNVQFKLVNKLDEMFEKSKSSIRLAIAKSPEDSQDKLVALKKSRPETVNCVSTNRVRNLVRFCDCLKLIGPSIWPIFGVEY